MAFPPSVPKKKPTTVAPKAKAPQQQGKPLVSNKPAPKSLPNTGTNPAKAGGAQPAPAKKTAVPAVAPKKTAAPAPAASAKKSSTAASPRPKAAGAAPRKSTLAARGSTDPSQQQGQQDPSQALQQQAQPAPQHVHNIRVHIHSGTNAGPSQQSAPPSPQGQQPMQQAQAGMSEDGSDMGGQQDGSQQPMQQQGNKPGFDPASNPTFGTGTSGIQQPGGQGQSGAPLMASQRRGAPKGSPQGQGSGEFNGGGSQPLGLQSRNGASLGSMNAKGQATQRKKKLPVKPPKAPPMPADVANARRRQSNVLKQRQAREMAGKVAGPYRDADAGAGAWPFLGTLM